MNAKRIYGSQSGINPYHEQGTRLLSKFEVVYSPHWVICKCSSRCISRAGSIYYLTGRRKSQDSDLRKKTTPTFWGIPKTRNDIQHRGGSITSKVLVESHFIEVLQNGQFPWLNPFYRPAERTKIRERMTRFLVLKTCPINNRLTVYYSDSMQDKKYNKSWMRCMSEHPTLTKLAQNSRCNGENGIIPTMVADCLDSRRCQVWKYHGKYILQLPKPLHPTTYSWPSTALEDGHCRSFWGIYWLDDTNISLHQLTIFPSGTKQSQFKISLDELNRNWSRSIISIHVRRSRDNCCG